MLLQLALGSRSSGEDRSPPGEDLASARLRVAARDFWQGSRPANSLGDRIDMLLDLDAGISAMPTGLTGEYVWGAALYGFSSVRIESAPAPAPPTAEELAAAAARPESSEDESSSESSDDGE